MKKPKPQERVPTHLFSKKGEEGYTLAELLVGTVISLAVLIAGFSLVKNILEVNKSDQTNIALSDEVGNLLELLVDEINSGKRVITNIDQLESHCDSPNGEFVIGISFPLQAVNLDSYSVESEENESWKKIDCPVIYSLERNTGITGERIIYKLLRTGPEVDNKGYYLANKIFTSNVLNHISSIPSEEMICSEGWEKKEVKGIAICTDKYRRAAEILITAEKLNLYNKHSTITRTSGGFTRVIDSELMYNPNSNLPKTICKIPGQCCVNVICPKSDGITYLISTNSGMSWGKKIDGMSPFAKLKADIMNSIENLSPHVKVQVVGVANNYSNSRFMFTDGPKELTASNRLKAMQWLSSLNPSAGGTTDIWIHLIKSIQDQNVGNIIAIIGPGTNIWDVSEPRSGSPICKRKYWYQPDHPYDSNANCFKEYNDNVRMKEGSGAVIIDAIGLKTSSWQSYGCGFTMMGRLTDVNGGQCHELNQY